MQLVGALILRVLSLQRQPPLFEDQWCTVSLGSYGCMEVTVTEARGQRKGNLQQGLAMLRSAALSKGLVSSLLDLSLTSSRLRCPYLALHLGVCHGPSSLWLLSEAMEVGTLDNLISSGSPPMTWLQTVRLVGSYSCVLPSCHLHGLTCPCRCWMWPAA